MRRSLDVTSSGAAAEAPATIEDFLAQQRNSDLLRFITCGSVDDGKSTLIGRLLWDAKQLFDDQVTALQNESKRFRTPGRELDFSLLLDGLAAEREQGITIDVAYRFFATSRRRFIVADTPGHEQYTRNMITGASTADAAILLVDARAGLLTQTRRHAFLASLMGIRHVALTVNKMDLVGFDRGVFDRIAEEFRRFASEMGFTITVMPISARNGDNITERSPHTVWYNGPTLMGYLEAVEILKSTESARAAFPVQWVNRPNSDFRGYSGTIADGLFRVGDHIRVTASGQTAKITDIVTMDGSLKEARSGDAITLCLDRDVDASRGDVIALADAPLETTDQFEATLVWLHDAAGLVGRNYELKLSTQSSTAAITNIKYRIEPNTLAHEAIRELELNDISVCNVATTKPIVFDAYGNSKSLGSFILIDRITHETVAAGMIRHNLRRAQNVHRQSLSITCADRERINGHKGRVIWFTGLSGAGKSTIANALEVELFGRGVRTYVLDGDNIRHGLNKDLGFTDADRVENIRRVAEVAKLMMDAGLVVMTAFISPFQREREMARELIGPEHFIEVYVNTPLDVCEQRDTKGLYKKARMGKIPNMTGVNSTYEPPSAPSCEVRADKTTIEESVQAIMRLLT